MNKYFNPYRFGYLAKREAITNTKMGIYFLTIVALYSVASILIFLVNSLEPTNVDFLFKDSLNQFFPGFLYLGGYIFTAMAFEEINDKFKSSLWLTNPSSTLEKYLVSMLISGIGYVIFLVVAFFVASMVSNIFTRPFFGTGMNFFNPFKSVNDFKVLWYMSLGYLFSHGMFLIGSIVYKKAAFIKTALVVSGISICYSIFYSVVLQGVFKAGIVAKWDYRLIDGIVKFFNQKVIDGSIGDFMSGWLIFSGALFCIFLNVVAYLKLKEKEVKGGV